MTTDISHSTVQEVLPGFVNGTASDAEREMVTSHLATCADCRDELSFLQQIRSAVTEEASATPPFRSQFSPTMAKIDALESARPVSVIQRVRDVLGAVWPPGTPVRTVLVVQFAAIVLLAGIVVLRQPEASFTTLSGGETPAGAGPRLTVMFQPGATEETIRRALRDVNGTVVSGPSAAGVYLIELPGPSDDARAIDRAIDALRSQTNVVRFVEQQP
jgi:hypothetical protein